jgi:hypothetical protein
MKKSFDSVEWMRTRRAKIDEEDHSLSWEEKREKTLQLLEIDPLWRRLKSRAIEPAAVPPMAVREPHGEYGVRPEE